MLAISSRNHLHYAVKNLCENLLFLGREYALGYAYFRVTCHNAFWKNKDIDNRGKIVKRLKHGDYIIKALEALYMLGKYRTLRSRYYKDDPHHETLLKATQRSVFEDYWSAYHYFYHWCLRNMSKQQRTCAFMLTFVRHGETDANVIGLVQGHGVDSSINRSGRAQSKKIERRLCDEKFDLILSSDLKRTRQTSEVIVEGNRLSDKSIIYDKLLRGRCFGVAEGRYYHELDNVAFPSEDKEEYNLPEGAESLRELENRADNFFQNLCWKIIDLESSSNINVLIVSHGGFLACLFKCFSKIYDCQFPRGVNPGYLSVNTSMSKFEGIITCNHTSQTINNVTINCLCINDASHLS